jgi:hypothetical protein
MLLLLLPTALAAQVERSDLPPLPGIDATDPVQENAAPPGASALPFPPQTKGSSLPGSVLPPDLWRGADTEAMQKLLAAVRLPSPSPMLAVLIARALGVDTENRGPELVVRAEALKKAGQVEQVASVLARQASSKAPRAAARYVLALLALGREEEACAFKLAMPPDKTNTDSVVARATFLVPVYCEAVRRDHPAAELSLKLARDNDVEAGIATDVIGRLSKTSSRAPSLPERLDALDYLFLRLDKQSVSPTIVERATPELLFVMAGDKTAPPELRLEAAERAAALNIIDGKRLALAYREAEAALPKDAQSPPALRARLFVAFERAPSTKIRAESIDALLKSARNEGIDVPVAQALASTSAGLLEDPEAAAYAETGVRVAALAGDGQSAWAWVDAGGERLQSWQLLLAAGDGSDARAKEGLRKGVDVALKGGLPAPLLHRLITVLDALAYEVPIPLWDAASKTDQPQDGYLPETGTLTSLKQAADAGEVGRTILLAGIVLGPKGAPGAHMIALGDALRALERVGLEAEARRLGFEALYAHWPAQGKV